MKKRLLALATSALMLFGLLAGCGGGDGSTTDAPSTGGGSEPAAGGEIVINMYHSFSADTDRGRALFSLVDQFNEQNAGSIRVEVDVNNDFPAYQEKVKAMISADEAPDIFHYNFNPNDLSLHESGKLLDFSPYMDDAWSARFNAGDLDTLIINGQLLSIPYETGPALIYYNKTVLAEAGYDAFPTTWDEVFDMFDAIQANGVQPLTLYTADDAWYTCNLLTYFAASVAGTGTFNANESINTPEMAKAAGYLRGALDYTTSDFIGANYSVALSAFNTGKTAIVIDGSWLIGSLDEEIIEHVGIAPAPTFGDGVVTPGFMVTDAPTPFAAAAQSDPEKEAAIVEFMKFITSEEATKVMTLEGQVFLSAKMTLTDAELSDVSPLMAEYIQTTTLAGESLVNLQRNLSTAANSKLPSLIESLALDIITAEEFVEQLAAEN